MSSDLEIHQKCPKIHGKPVPDLEVSRRGKEDQGRHGGRRLLEKSDNDSLEEAESEESKNCTAPGTTEWKKEDAPAAASQLPPPPFTRQIEDGGNKWSPPHVLFSSLCGPSVLASWWGVTQIVSLGDFPRAQPPTGAAQSPSHGFSIPQVSPSRLLPFSSSAASFPPQHPPKILFPWQCFSL